MQSDDFSKPKLKNRALLKFSKEALAYYAETVTLFRDQMVRDLEVLDRYFRSLRSLERQRAICQRLDEINKTIDAKPKMAWRTKLKLIREVDSLIRKLNPKKGKGNGTGKGKSDS